MQLSRHSISIMKLLLIFASILLCIVLGNAVPEDPAKKLTLQVSLANDEFNAHLLQSLEEQSGGKNVFISSFSISTALAMLMTGAANQTYSQIYNSLGYVLILFNNFLKLCIP